MTNNKPKFMSQRVRASVAAILGSTLLSGYAAQSFSAEEKLEEIQVTGSRITRRDLESNSPIVSIDNAALEAKSGLNIESYLNQLPAFNPAGSPTVKGGTGSNSDVQISAVSSVGIASISLRGFGPNRGLVLMDGHRATPTNALMVVDVNSVPSSMIKRVEIISGGASATYGADAIAGVSNFILRKDFQGLEADIQQGITQAGDGQELRASALMGSKFADGRGNVVFAAEYYNREAAYEKNRDFYKKGWADPTVGGNFLGFVFGVNGYNPSSNNYSPAALAGILGKTTAVVTGPSGVGSNGIRFNPDSVIRSNESLSLDAVRFLTAYNRFIPGANRTRLGDRFVLIKALEALDGDPVRFHSNLLAPLAEEIDRVVATLNARYGIDLTEDLTAADGSPCLREEADLFRFNQTSLNWLAERSGSPRIQAGNGEAVARAVASQVDRIRRRPVLRIRWAMLSERLRSKLHWLRHGD